MAPRFRCLKAWLITDFDVYNGGLEFLARKVAEVREVEGVIAVVEFVFVVMVGCGISNIACLGYCGSGVTAAPLEANLAVLCNALR